MCNCTISGAGTGLFFCAKYTRKLKNRIMVSSTAHQVTEILDRERG